MTKSSRPDQKETVERRFFVVEGSPHRGDDKILSPRLKTASDGGFLVVGGSPHRGDDKIFSPRHEKTVCQGGFPNLSKVLPTGGWQNPLAPTIHESETAFHRDSVCKAVFVYWEIEDIGWLPQETQEYIPITGKIGFENGKNPLFGHVTKIP